MPFTVSHVAAVVPGYRPLSRAGLFGAAVIGSMVPDFSMFLPGDFPRTATHSPEALLTFCLPVGLAAYLIMALLIRPALLQVVPDGAYARLRATPAAALRRARTWVYVALAILGGAMTHLIWDGFTHENAPGVQMFPTLNDHAPAVAGHTLLLYRWLQYASSVFGLLVVVAALAVWLRHAPAPAERPQRRLGGRERAAWLALYLLLPLAVMAAALSHRGWPGHAPHASLRLGTLLYLIAIAGLRGSAASLVLWSALIRLRTAA